MSKPCAVEHCPWPAVCHAMCSIHYQRWRRRGTTSESRPVAGRFWAELQRDEYTPQIPRDVMIAAMATLITHDALDLAPMLFAPLNPVAGRS